MTMPQFPHDAAATELLAALVSGLEKPADAAAAKLAPNVTVEQVTTDHAVGSVTSLVVGPDGTRYRVTVEPLEATQAADAGKLP